MAGLSIRLPKLRPIFLGRNVARNKEFASATRLLQKSKDKEAEEAYKKVADAAKALQDAAKEKRKTSESVKEAVSTTASTVTKMSKEVSEKIFITADHVSGKAKDTIWETVKAAAGAVTDKVTKDW